VSGGKLSAGQKSLNKTFYCASCPQDAVVNGADFQGMSADGHSIVRESVAIYDLAQLAGKLTESGIHAG